MLTPSIPEAAPPVRLARPEDEPDLVAMIAEMHTDSEWVLCDVHGVPFPFNEGKTLGAVLRAVAGAHNNPEGAGALIGVVGEVGRLQGSAMVRVQEADMSDGLFLIERWNWCRPTYRHGETSNALIAFSMAIADLKRLTLVTAAMTRQRIAKSRFYERKFGPPVGNVYHYTPNGVAA